MSTTPEMTRLIVEGFVLGWSVAWPPGPINAEMIRRGITGHPRSGLAVGLGACSGDFLWALVVASGLGALANVPMLRPVLTGVSFLLLLLLAWVFLSGAVQSWRAVRCGRFHEMTSVSRPTTAGGYALGLTLALTSPWNIAFWFGVLGYQSGAGLPIGSAVIKAAAVVGGALTWCIVLAVALRLGARFATPTWDITTRALTGLLMLFFAGRLILNATTNLME
jgi:threonine/homoserine/homoserine lactone efflux protein